MHPCQSHGRVSAQQARGANFGKTWPTPVRKGGALHHERLDLNPTGDSRGNWSWELWMFFAGYSKGFDLIDHSILLRELMSFDISTVLINWIRAFLTGRSQAVRIGNSLSDWKSPRGGIPQGTKLGVILFAVMTNNLLRVWHLRIKFVDDTTALDILSRNGI